MIGIRQLLDWIQPELFEPDRIRLGIIELGTNDPSIGKFKEEITNDKQILPFDTQDRIFAYLVSIEGSTTSSGSGSGVEGNEQSKHPPHHRDDTILTSTTNLAS